MDLTGSLVLDLMRSSGALISVFDDNDRLRFANPGFRNAFGLSENDWPTWAEMMRANWEKRQGAAIEAVDFEKWLSSTQSRRGKLPFRGFEADLFGGTWIWMTETVGDNGWMLCLAVDITSLASKDRDVRYARDLALRASRTDDLTGVANRRQMMERLEDMVAQQAGGSIAILDIDHFKSINDTFGHAGGDAVLIDFARRVSQSVRRSDCFGRIGGEEFLFIMPDACPQTATDVLDRIRSELRDSQPLPDNQDFRYTFSVGVTALADIDSAQTILSRADEACYAAKKSGRDRIVQA